MSNRLVDMELDEISLVRKGAHQFATVAIAKSLQGEEEEMEEDLFDQNGDPIDPGELGLGDVVYDEEGNSFEVVPDEEEDGGEDEEVEKAYRGVAGAIGRKVARGNRGGAGFGAKAGLEAGFRKRQVRGAANAAAGAAAGATGSALTAARGVPARLKALGSGLGENAQAAFSRGYIGARQGALAARGHIGRNSTAYAAGAAGLGGAALGSAAGGRRKKDVSKSYDLREEFSKALTDQDRDEVISKAFEAIEQLSVENQTALEIAKSEQDKRIFNEYVSIAKSYTLPFADEDVALAMMEAEQNLSQEACEIIAKSFEMASEMLGSSIGVDGIGSDVMDGISTGLDEIGKSADPVTIAELLEKNPELYDEYLAERG